MAAGEAMQVGCGSCLTARSAKFCAAVVAHPRLALSAPLVPVSWSSPYQDSASGYVTPTGPQSFAPASRFPCRLRVPPPAHFSLPPWPAPPPPPSARPWTRRATAWSRRRPAAATTSTPGAPRWTTHTPSWSTSTTGKSARHCRVAKGNAPQGGRRCRGSHATPISPTPARTTHPSRALNLSPNRATTLVGCAFPALATSRLRP